MNLLSYFFPRVIGTSHSKYNKVIRVLERYGKKELYVNGIQQSGPYTIRLWKTGLRYIVDNPIQTVRTILVLGVGGGTLFEMLISQYPNAHITAIDIDEQIIALFEKYFVSKKQSSLTLVCTDAKDYVRLSVQKGNTYDLVIVDLYTGNDVPEFVTHTDFLTSLKRITAKSGMLVWNYFSFKHQTRNVSVLLDRLSVIYQSVIRKDILRNIFFYCR